MYGVEAARTAITREISAVFGVYGISVDMRHLVRGRRGGCGGGVVWWLWVLDLCALCVEGHVTQRRPAPQCLIADYMTFSGGFRALNRQGIASSLADLFAKETIADNVFYLACDLQILLRDLRHILAPGRYKIREVIPFDMFPRTKHIEVLTRLQRM